MWKNPAKIPLKKPNSPAIGARVVPNKAAKRLDVDRGLTVFKIEARNTPIKIGIVFLGCLPNAEKPVTVKIPPIIGTYLATYNYDVACRN